MRTSDDPAGGGPPEGDPPDGRPAGRVPPGRLQKGPFVDECARGKYAWCRCSKSQRYPYCDGTHRGTDITPVKVVLEEPRTIVWCACGATCNAPFCDGSHSRL